MKTKLIFLLLLFPKIIFSQVYEDDMKQGILLRGKVLGFVIIEDLWILNATAGAEFRFHKNYSLGIDFVHMNTINEQEDYYDSTDTEKYREYSQKNKRNCLLIDFRFYPFQEKLQGKKLKPYISTFSKIGGANKFAQEEWKFQNDDVVRQNEDFYDIGITAGAHLNFANRKGGLDFNIGYCKRYINENVEYFVEGGPNRFVENQIVVQDRLAGRVNLYIYLWRNKTITQ